MRVDRWKSIATFFVVWCLLYGVAAFGQGPGQAPFAAAMGVSAPRVRPGRSAL